MKGMNVLSLFDGLSGGQIALERSNINVNNYYAAEIDKYAIAVTQHNYPKTIQLGCVTKINKCDLPEIDMIIGGSPCFTKTTKIITDGQIKSIQDVKVGDRVLTHTGAYHRVLKVGSQRSMLYSLKAQSHTGTETTREHPYYVRSRSKIWDNKRRCYVYTFSDPQWKEVHQITKGDYVATPILSSSLNPFNLTEDECFLIGVYIGDGHTRKDFKTSEGRPSDRNWQLIISVGAHEEQLFHDKIKIKHSFYEHTQSTYRAAFSSKRLVQYVEENCGIGADNKHLSKGILDLPKNLLKKVIEGYLFADGSFRKNTHRATTVSKDLVESLTLAVAKVYETTTSIEFTQRPNKTIICGREVNQKNTWTISFRENHPKQSRAWVIGGFIWNPIKFVGCLDSVDDVYNLEVEKDNSYVANNHVVHNCQGFSFAGKQLNFNDPRSALFFEFVRLLKELKPKYFLLENVKMKKEYQDVISGYLGVEPIEINSSLVSAQNRKRLYWTNISNISQPEDKKIYLKDVIEEGLTDRDKSYCIDANYFKGGNLKSYFEKGRRQLIFNREDIKMGAFRGRYNSKGVIEQQLEVRKDLKSNSLTTVQKDNVLLFNKVNWRKLTPKECERLQTISDDYTLVPWQKRMMSNSQRYKMIGNGWTIDVISHIFNHIKKTKD